jgi:pyruvate/2-oxoglutarate dehydrogenase complex dihydrolipoamide dehydrogenase (E3) component
VKERDHPFPGGRLDLVIIGSGPGGYVGQARPVGLKIAIVKGP